MLRVILIDCFFLKNNDSLYAKTNNLFLGKIRDCWGQKIGPFRIVVAQAYDGVVVLDFRNHQQKCSR